MTRAIPAALAVLALAACSEGVSPGGEPADAPRAVESETGPAADPLSVRADGVGPLTAETPFDPDAVSALFPASDVEAAFLHLEGAPEPIITVTGPDNIVLELRGADDGGLSRIAVQGGPWRGPLGEQLLAPWPGLGLAAADCVMGEGPSLGQPLCRRAEAPGLILVLSVPNWRGHDLPDPTTLNGRARLAEWVWTRP